ncbi:MAG: hypothetical protein FJW90_07305 [Actinobacteria bacterium]|nr:hypothetical protein [Actinomycetota bacterium]
MKIRARVGVISAFAVTALLGCGGGGETIKVETVDAAPSKRDYIVAADTICINSEQGIRTEAEIRFKLGADDFTISPTGEVSFKPGRRPSDAEIQRFGERVVVPAFRGQVADLRGLTPPEGDRAAVEAIYAAAERGIDELEADSALFLDSAAVRERLSEARRLGRRYGFFNCGTYSAP